MENLSQQANIDNQHHEKHPKKQRGRPSKQSVELKQQDDRKSIGSNRKSVAFSNLPPFASSGPLSSACARTTSAEKDKRISFSLRGQRKTSFADVQSSIHPDIDPADFHKHVNPKLPDPLRLRQIIVYAMSHQMASVKAKSQDESEARKVLDHCLRLLLEKRISTSWFSRPRTVNEGVVVTLPNPANSELRARIAGYRQVIANVRRSIEEFQHDQHVSYAHVSSADKVMMPMEDVHLAPTIPQHMDDSIMDGSVKSACESIGDFRCKLAITQTFASIHGAKLHSNFARAIDACWQSESDDIDALLEPFSSVCAKAGRRLSFNLTKNDESIKMLRALAAVSEE